MTPLSESVNPTAPFIAASPYRRDVNTGRKELMGTKGDERRAQIAKAAVEVAAERGYYGMTIQEVADRVGLSQAGLLKYVGSKAGLLSVALEAYDTHNEGVTYIEDKLALSPEELERSPALMPEWYRLLARTNLRQPRLTQLYLVLRAEALNPAHPAHDYYAQRGMRLRRYIGTVPWKLPPEFATPDQVAALSMTVGSAMDGLQMRWLGEPGIDLVETWARYEDILFPLPHWQGYR